MTSSGVTIYRDLPIINGYVQLPPNRERDKSRVTWERAFDTIPGSFLVHLSLGSGPGTGSKFGAQRLLRFPATPAAFEAVNSLQS